MTLDEAVAAALERRSESSRLEEQAYYAGQFVPDPQTEANLRRRETDPEFARQWDWHNGARADSETRGALVFYVKRREAAIAIGRYDAQTGKLKETQ